MMEILGCFQALAIMSFAPRKIKWTSFCLGLGIRGIWYKKGDCWGPGDQAVGDPGNQVKNILPELE